MLERPHFPAIRPFPELQFASCAARKSPKRRTDAAHNFEYDLSAIYADDRPSGL
ncbi:hypothetical protein SJ05684_b49300 (plasmid) [Sinorhizobium sojae CCBAU 05684]|uniref:Uncharacterized protein n=1 Tax=Sinorhizobium sojae CCBAU 05684 TaxID=716928 RepID=A0A249PJJ5_9HYPH|nr:hypothetical protein SJ05684_b49300 [Sinorhizobium sojae CCBAU 05684]